jgi:hypothetical protein
MIPASSSSTYYQAIIGIIYCFKAEMTPVVLPGVLLVVLP